MSGASLFPDEYPTTARKDRPASCCADLVAPYGVDLRAWTFLHSLCHSRVPFTVAAYMAAASLQESDARTAISEAKQRDWLHVVWPESYMTDPIEAWVGCLPRRR